MQCKIIIVPEEGWFGQPKYSTPTKKILLCRLLLLFSSWFYPRKKCFPPVFDTSSKISAANWSSYPLVEETRPSKWHQRRVVFSRPYIDMFFTNMGRTSVLGELRMRQQNIKAIVPLDVVPERRTERCSPRFRPGGRFWSQVSDTCRQAGRERNVGP